MFRFEDGSLLTVQLTEGTLCVDIADPAHPVGRQFETYQITGGTGRFKRCRRELRRNGQRVHPSTDNHQGLVLRDSSGAPKFITFTGEFQGTAPHFGNERRMLP